MLALWKAESSPKVNYYCGMLPWHWENQVKDQDFIVQSAVEQLWDEKDSFPQGVKI